MNLPPAQSGDLRISRGHGLEVPLDRYRLLAKVGAGRTGIAYLAVPRELVDLESLLIVRALRPELVGEEPVVRAFTEQARLAARLAHRNIVQTLNFGVRAGRPFAVMEYVDGLTLDRLLTRARQCGMPMTRAMQLLIVLDVLSALQCAHSVDGGERVGRGVVHGQLSPTKVFVTENGYVKVVDFGFPHTAVLPAETPTAPLLENVRYTAPEIVTTNRADGRSDVFAAGVMLWEVMLGRPPHDGQSDVLVLQRLISDGRPYLVDFARTADLELRAILQRAMAPDAGRRYPSASAMRDALERYASARLIGTTVGDSSTGEEDHRAARHALGALVTALSANERRTIMEIVEAHLG